jgi:hypothetical protein
MHVRTCGGLGLEPLAVVGSEEVPVCLLRLPVLAPEVSGAVK